MKVDKRNAKSSKHTSEPAKEQRKKETERMLKQNLDAPPRKADLVFVPQHERPVTDLAYDKERGYLYSSCKDKAICRWNTHDDDFRVKHTLCGHNGAVYCVSLHGDKIYSGGADALICIWDRLWEAPFGKVYYEYYQQLSDTRAMF